MTIERLAHSEDDTPTEELIEDFYDSQQEEKNDK